MKGKLLAFEGCDGAGTEEISKRTSGFLKGKGFRVESFSYPDQSGPVGRFINNYLQSDIVMMPETKALLYAADMVKDLEKIRTLLNGGFFVVFDRYFTSTLAYQFQEGVPLEKIRKLGEVLGLPEPDYIFYLKVDPKIARDRKFKEKKNPDRNERDLALQKGVAGAYDRLAREGVFGRWFVIDAGKSIPEVLKQVKKVLRL